MFTELNRTSNLRFVQHLFSSPFPDAHTFGRPDERASAGKYQANFIIEASQVFTHLAHARMPIEPSKVFSLMHSVRCMIAHMHACTLCMCCNHATHAQGASMHVRIHARAQSKYQQP